MKQPHIAGELFPDHEAVQKALERRTRDALLRRLGPSANPVASDETDRLPTAAAVTELFPGQANVPAEAANNRAIARGIGFGVDLVRAILNGRKTQTRRLMRPQPQDATAIGECPIARAGELLYVREPWLRQGKSDAAPVLYAADQVHATGLRFRPAMYMPRSAARLWLRVTAVRAERLGEISPGDLAAEGLPPGQSLASVWDAFYPEAGQRFADNPWVWVIAFHVELRSSI